MELLSFGRHQEDMWCMYPKNDHELHELITNYTGSLLTTDHSPFVTHTMRHNDFKYSTKSAFSFRDKFNLLWRL